MQQQPYGREKLSSKHIQLKDMPPYTYTSQVNYRLLDTTTTGIFLQRYDPQLLQKISGLAPNLMNQTLYLINCDMQPDNKQWMLWKNNDQLMRFLLQFDNQIEEMMSMRQRMSPDSNEIQNMWRELKSARNINLGFVEAFIKWLSMVAGQVYLRKTQDYMIFIEHCVPIDKWHMQIYKQMVIHRKPSVKHKVVGFFSNQTKHQRIRDYFLTITSEGLLKSDNHLMQSRIRRMLPFTNQMQISRYVDSDNFVTYSLVSCTHQAMNICFYDDYVQAINFGCGLGKALEESAYNKPHSFQSYAQRRQNCDSKLYNDGFQYYDDMYEEISRAQFQICMTGWMITPYFRLRRPGPITDRVYRLDGALEAAAKRGVRVFVICFMEPKGFVNNDSELVQQLFESLHKNIQVVRHPNGAIPLLWSHHQKMMVIDQRIGFMGGLDICYGRWDTPDHFMFDPSDVWNGLQYNNFRTKDVVAPRLYEESYLNPSIQPRMPWHDIAIQLRGDSVIDMLRHFVQYWYFVKEQLQFDSVKFFQNTKKRFTEAINHEDIQVRKEMKEYMDIVKSQQQHNTSQNTLEKWRNKFKVFVSGQQIIINELFIDMRPGQVIGPERQQMCRSASTWSIGVRNGNHQQSIHNAYQELITESKQFIYIENQFFMGLQNKIVQTLAKRISRAYQQRQPFKVVVVMPLLPGFQGDITDPSATVLRIQVHHQFQAIKRGNDALYKRLAHIPNLDEYIFFFGLRQSCVLQGCPITQIIYVHSKLMIVDDERFIIGSANINDRSLLGTRDSQIAIVVDEQPGGDKCFNLRARLFQEHFDLTDQETKNFMNPLVWNKMLQNAKSNTMIYREVFGCIPDDTVTLATEVRQLEKKANINRYADLRGRIVGHACVFPLDFLRDQDLTFRPNQKEYFAPTSSFT